ncbi:hypothetical protein A2U01_0096331, partial [Trifolium medium]|nr:hypothetical protein [Trifolium medium]
TLVAKVMSPAMRGCAAGVGNRFTWLGKSIYPDFASY